MRMPRVPQGADEGAVEGGENSVWYLWSITGIVSIVFGCTTIEWQLGGG